jgi:hypothetical protein
MQEFAGSHAGSTIFAMFRYVGDLHGNTKVAAALLTHSRPAIPPTDWTTGDAGLHLWEQRVQPQLEPTNVAERQHEASAAVQVPLQQRFRCLAASSSAARSS